MRRKASLSSWTLSWLELLKLPAEFKWYIEHLDFKWDSSKFLLGLIQGRRVDEMYYLRPKDFNFGIDQDRMMAVHFTEVCFIFIIIFCILYLIMLFWGVGTRDQKDRVVWQLKWNWLDRLYINLFFFLIYAEFYFVIYYHNQYIGFWYHFVNYSIYLVLLMIGYRIGRRGEAQTKGFNEFHEYDNYTAYRADMRADYRLREVPGYVGYSPMPVPYVPEIVEVIYIKYEDIPTSDIVEIEKLAEHVYVKTRHGAVIRKYFSGGVLTPNKVPFWYYDGYLGECTEQGCPESFVGLFAHVLEMRRLLPADELTPEQVFSPKFPPIYKLDYYINHVLAPEHEFITREYFHTNRLKEYYYHLYILECERQFFISTWTQLMYLFIRFKMNFGMHKASDRWAELKRDLGVLLVYNSSQYERHVKLLEQAKIRYMQGDSSLSFKDIENLPENERFKKGPALFLADDYFDD